MRSLAIFLLVALVAACGVSADPLARAVVYDRPIGELPPGYRLSGSALPSDQIRVVFAMKQQNLDVLDAKFWAVSDPDHADYQNYMTAGEVLDLVSAPAADRDALVQWLVENGVSAEDILDQGDAVVVRTDAATAAMVFETTFFRFTHTNGKQIVRQLGIYSLPVMILDMIEFVSGVSDFPMPQDDMVRGDSNDQTAVAVSSLQSIYNIPSSASASGSSLGVGEFGAGEYFSPSGLQTFATDMGVTIEALSQNHIVGGSSSPGIEAVLDIQWALGLADQGTGWFWTTATWLYDFAQAFSAASDKPEVISLSYGWSESSQCQITSTCSILGIDSEQYVARVNTEFQKIGVQGTSLLVASGDSGANGRTDPSCVDPKLKPAFPAASPYVTAVGATQVDNGTPLSSQPAACSKSRFTCVDGGSLSAVSYEVSRFASGGGFSDYTPQPSYQSAAVAAYLSSGVELPPSSYFNSGNRGFPDVSSIGHNVLIYVESQGGWIPVGGTSASSPSFAGYTALLNNVSRSKTGKPLGFLNPFLYKMAAAQADTFIDITKGNNKCTEEGCSSSCKGFVCAAGWDPVTGLGGLNVSNALSYVSSMLDARIAEERAPEDVMVASA